MGYRYIHIRAGNQNQFQKGKITFTLFGHKLKGKFTLVRTHLDREKEGKQWLLIKLADEFESNEELTITRPNSVLTSRINKDLEKENRPYNKKDKTKVSFNKPTKISDIISQNILMLFRTNNKEKK